MTSADYLTSFDLIVEHRWGHSDLFEVEHYSSSPVPTRFYQQYPPIMSAPGVTYVYEIRVNGRFERAEFHSNGQVLPFAQSFLDTAVTCPTCPGYDLLVASMVETARQKMNEQTAPIRLRVILAVGVLSCLPAVFLWVSPAFYNPVTAYLLSVLLMAIPLVIGLSSSHAETARRIMAARTEAARTEKEKWLPQAQSACDRLLTIGADASILKDSLSCGCSNIQNALSGLSEEHQRLVRQVFDGHCQTCLSAITGVINHLEGAASDWERFIQRNCAEGECEQIFAELERTKRRLDVTVREARARRAAQQRAEGCATEDQPSAA